MKKLTVLVLSFFTCLLSAQSPSEKPKATIQSEVQAGLSEQEIGEITDKALQQIQAQNDDIAVETCKCIDSIALLDRSIPNIRKDVNKCMENGFFKYQIGQALKQSMSGVDSVVVHTDPGSKQYQLQVDVFKEELMNNCGQKIVDVFADNKVREKSMSDNPKAIDFYMKGVDYLKNQDFTNAIPYFEKAVKEDPDFAFAWDNLGVSYRRTDQLDKAIKAYKKSMELEPDSEFPIQNIAVAYLMKGDYKTSISYYEKLGEDNPERYFGIGKAYLAQSKLDQGLDNMCKAYNIYLEQNSPLSDDARKVISSIYAEYNSKGELDTFNKILEENNITVTE